MVLLVQNRRHRYEASSAGRSQVDSDGAYRVIYFCRDFLVTHLDGVNWGGTIPVGPTNREYDD